MSSWPWHSWCLLVASLTWLSFQDLPYLSRRGWDRWASSSSAWLHLGIALPPNSPSAWSLLWVNTFSETHLWLRKSALVGSCSVSHEGFWPKHRGFTELIACYWHDSTTFKIDNVVQIRKDTSKKVKTAYLITRFLLPSLEIMFDIMFHFHVRCTCYMLCGDVTVNAKKNYWYLQL